MKTRLYSVLLVLAALAATPAAGHDYWVEPKSFTAEPGSLVLLDLRVGDEAPGDSLPYDPTHAETFILVGPEGQQPILGEPGQRPAGTVRLGKGGLYAVAYDSVERSVTLSPESFESYLREEGLDHIIEKRRKLGESQRPGRELFSRCAKTLVYAGNESFKEIQREEQPALTPLGLELEVVPENLPVMSSNMTLRLLLRGEPLTGVQLEARLLADEDSATFETTDATGRATFSLPSKGPWLITAIHMERANTSPDHEWRSLWASLTFLAHGER